MAWVWWLFPPKMYTNLFVNLVLKVMPDTCNNAPCQPIDR